MPALRNGRPPYDIIWQVFADALSRRNISKQALREVALKILTYIEYYEMFLSFYIFYIYLLWELKAFADLFPLIFCCCCCC